MKKCTNCGAELDDAARFCGDCGTRQPETEESELSAVELEKPEAETELHESQPADSQTEPEKTNQPEDMPKLTDLDEDAPVYDSFAQSAPEPETPESAETEWYYVQNQQPSGPYTETEMIHSVKGGLIGRDTFVWTEGMDSWQRLDTTVLAAHLPEDAKHNPFAPETREEQTHGYDHGNTFPPLVEKRSLPVYLLLSFVTCGIFALVWQYQIADTVNRLLVSKNRQPLTDAALVLLWTILTGGLYWTFYVWKSTRALADVDFNGWKMGNQTTVLTVCSIFVDLISICMYQSLLNEIADAE